MKIYDNPSKSELKAILRRPLFEQKDLEDIVKTILENVRKKGDTALLDYGERFDEIKLDTLKVSAKEISRAVDQVSDKLKAAIKTAKSNIWRFHNCQKENIRLIETMPGVQCWRKSLAIQKVGLYVPGGTAPLFSTVLMLGIPARLAGCEELILCTPPQKDGTINPVILYTAQSLGIHNIYKVGGAQAIAAMAYGTETIPAVDKIFGPGNQYVTEAKQQVSREGIAMDLPAGPSELMVLADRSARPEFVAADLLSQAEHGPDSQVVLIAFERSLIERVKTAIEDQLALLPRAEIARKALDNSVAIVVRDRTEALKIANAYAPEHLMISLENAEAFALGIKNAGSVFLGNYTPESAGDYASGTNHTLPTNAYARAYSGVSLDSFVKKITFQKITPTGLKNLGQAVEEMAAAEKLEGHKQAVSLRLKELEKMKFVPAEKNPELKAESFSFSVNKLLRKDLRTFRPYASARHEFSGKAEVYLDANESPFETTLNRYPDPLQKKLKSEISKIKGVPVKNVFLGNGSDEAIDLLIRLFCETGIDSILTLPPTYGVYGVCARMAGVTVNALPLDTDFQPDIAALSGLAARNAKLLFICNPNNPSASIIPIDVIENIIKTFPGIVVVDEAYIDFADIDSGISLLEKYPNLVVLQTFSKAWGLAGLRLGMAFSSEEIITWLNKIKLPYNINQLTQDAVLQSLSSKEHVEAQIQLIRSERSRLSALLQGFDFVQKVFPSQTNFLLVRMKNPQVLYQFLLKKGIIVRDRSRQLNCEGCLRITIGTPEENDRLMEALTNFQTAEKLDRPYLITNI